MIAYFPVPYEDELLYSWLARYYSKAGYLAYTLAAEDLFANKRSKPSIEFVTKLTPAALEAIERYVPRAKLIEKHTMFPYYTRFLDRKRRHKAFNAIMDMEDGYFNLLCVSKSKEHTQRYLRYCSMCAADDRKEHGETYWHRLHQMNGVNLCPIHGIPLESSDVTISSNGSPSLITAEELIPFVDGTTTPVDSLEWRLAQYIADVFSADIDMESDVPLGAFLHSQMENTKYLSQRGEQRNMTLLHEDFCKFYRSSSGSIMEQWQIQKLFSGNRTTMVDICMIAMFLGCPSETLVHMRLPDRRQQDFFDSEIILLREQGLNYRQIATYMNASYDVVKAIGEGAYKRYHYPKYNPLKSGAKKRNWETLDAELLPRVQEIIKHVLGEADSRPERITLGRVERLLSLPSKCLSHCPMCLRLIVQNTESQEEFWARSVVWAANKLISEGTELHLTGIMRLINIRKKDYLRCKQYLPKYRSGDVLEDLLSLA